MKVVAAVPRELQRQVIVEAGLREPRAPPPDHISSDVRRGAGLILLVVAAHMPCSRRAGARAYPRLRRIGAASVASAAVVTIST